MAAAPGVAAPLRRPRRKGEITAERILDAAEALFAEHGYAGTTLRDVAERVGIRIPSLYNHFESKDALYAAVLERGIGPVLAMLSELVASGRDAARESHAIVSRVMEQLAKRPALPRLLLHETLSGGQRLTPALRDWIAPTFARAHEVAAASAGDRWRPDQIPLLVLALYHIAVGYFTIAPFYADLNGQDLMAPEALERQTEFFASVVDALFPNGETPPDPR